MVNKINSMIIQMYTQLDLQHTHLQMIQKELNNDPIEAKKSKDLLKSLVYKKHQQMTKLVHDMLELPNERL